MYLTLADPANPTVPIKQFSSERLEPLLLGRASRTDRGASDPASPKFRTSETKVMSTTHAKIHWDRDYAFITDLDSTNGTCLVRDGEQQKLKPDVSYRIFSQDRIIFGRPVTERSNGSKPDVVSQPLTLVAEVKATPTLPLLDESHELPSPALVSSTLSRDRTVTDGQFRTGSFRDCESESDEAAESTLLVDGSPRRRCTLAARLPSTVPEPPSSSEFSKAVSHDCASSPPDVEMRLHANPKRGFGLSEADLLSSREDSPAAPGNYPVEQLDELLIETPLAATTDATAASRVIPSAPIASPATDVTTVSHLAVGGLPAPMDLDSVGARSPRDMSFSPELDVHHPLGLPSPVSPEFQLLEVTSQAERDGDEAAMLRSTNPLQSKVARTPKDYWRYYGIKDGSRSPGTIPAHGGLAQSLEEREPKPYENRSRPSSSLGPHVKREYYSVSLELADDEDELVSPSHLPSPVASVGGASDVEDHPGNVRTDSGFHEVAKLTASSPQHQAWTSPFDGRDEGSLEPFHLEENDIFTPALQAEKAGESNAVGVDSEEADMEDMRREPSPAGRRVANTDFVNTSPTLPHASPMIDFDLVTLDLTEQYGRFATEHKNYVAEYRRLGGGSGDEGSDHGAAEPPSTSSPTRERVTTFLEEQEDEELLVCAAEGAADNEAASIVNEVDQLQSSPASKRVAAHLQDQQEEEALIRDAEYAPDEILVEAISDVESAGQKDGDEHVASPSPTSRRWEYADSTSPLRSDEARSPSPADFIYPSSSSMPLASTHSRERTTSPNLSPGDVGEAAGSPASFSYRSESRPPRPSSLDGFDEFVSHVLGGQDAALARALMGRHGPHVDDRSPGPSDEESSALDDPSSDEESSALDDPSSDEESCVLYDPSSDEELGGSEEGCEEEQEAASDEDEDEDESISSTGKEVDEDEDQSMSESEGSQMSPRRPTFEVHADVADSDIELDVDQVEQDVEEVEQDLDAVDLDVDADPFVDERDMDLDAADPIVDECDTDGDEVDEDDGVDHDGAEWEDGVSEKLAAVGLPLEKVNLVVDGAFFLPSVLASAHTLTRVLRDTELETVDTSRRSASLSPTSPGRKRRLSDTDLEEQARDTDAGCAQPPVVVNSPSPGVTKSAQTDFTHSRTAAIIAAPLPKRRRLDLPYKSFALGVFTGIIGAVAGLSALGSALESLE
ncbi:hypothetical protein JCM3770_004119 [Rhodotorula araucariae]